jgi:hypothetical protein
MTATVTKTLSEITRAETEAEAAAAKAQRAAEIARIAAEAARAKAEQERELANRSYLDKLVAEHPAARESALTAAGEARQDLEHAVRGEGDVFSSYRRWVESSIAIWEVDSALTQQRHFHGLPTRETTQPAFNFALDVASIVDGIGYELQEQAIERIRERRASYLAGRESQ